MYKKNFPTTLKEARRLGFLFTEADDEENDNTEEDFENSEVESIIPPQDEVGTEKFMDDEITSMLIDFEAAAIQSANVNNEIKVPKLSSLIFEKAEIPNIDMERFAADVARLIKNYDSLLDLPAFIIGRAKAFIIDRYNSELAAELEETLEVRHDIVLEPDDEAVPDAPIAVGATSSDGGAL